MVVPRCLLCGKNLFMKEKLNKKRNINYIHYLQYTQVILLDNKSIQAQKLI